MHSCMSFDSLLLDVPYSAALKAGRREKMLFSVNLLRAARFPNSIPFVSKGGFFLRSPVVIIRAWWQGIKFVPLPVTHLPPIIEIIPLSLEEDMLIMPRSLLQSTARSQHPLPCTADEYDHHSFAKTETLVGSLQNWLDLPNDPLQVIDVQISGRTTKYTICERDQSAEPCHLSVAENKFNSPERQVGRFIHSI